MGGGSLASANSRNKCDQLRPKLEREALKVLSPYGDSSASVHCLSSSPHLSIFKETHPWSVNRFEYTDVFQSILNQLLKIQIFGLRYKRRPKRRSFLGSILQRSRGFLKAQSSGASLCALAVHMLPWVAITESSKVLGLLRAQISGSKLLLGHIFVEDSKLVLYLINAFWKMGKEKHRSKKGVATKPANTVVTETGVQRQNGQGGHGTSPFIAMALPPNSSENGGLIAKYVTEGYSESFEDIPEVESNDMAPSLVEVSEGAELEEESVSASRTLGDEDSASTQGVCQNANKIQGTDPKETAGLVEAKGRSGPTQGAGKQSYASLFENNRRPSLGSQLDQIETGDGPIPIEAEEVQDTWNPWKHCLVGYFGGRFPGKMALNQIVTAWKVPVKVHHHSSGWIMFQFEKRYLPMEYWNPRIFGKICTRLGKPIHMDKMTTYKERVSFARCLVEIDMEKDLPQAVMLKLPDGEIIEQPIFYENLPRFCKHCKLMGHSDAGCGANKNKPKNKQVEANKTAEVSNVEQLEQGTSVVATTNQTVHQIKRGKAEWVQVQNKTTNIQSGGRNAKPAINLELGNKFVALTAVDEQPQAQEVGSVQIQSNPEKQKTKIGEGQETNQIKQGNPLTGQSESRNNVLNGVQIQFSRSSLDQTQHNFNRSRGQVGGAGYIHQANQASNELKIRSHQNPKFQSGISAADQKKITSQIIRKAASVSTEAATVSTAPSRLETSQSFTSPCPPPSMAKGEEEEKKKESTQKMQTGRAGNQAQMVNGILEYSRKNNVDIMGILETKLKDQRTRDVVNHKFRRWVKWDNCQHHPNGRIMILWKADKVDLQILECSEQVIHCLAVCKVTNSKFSVSFVYAFNTIVGRRSLWTNLDRFNETLTDPWMVLGDFNNVLNIDERSNGHPVTQYEIKDFQQCCNKWGLTDMVYSGAHLTWTNNTTWCKLDRAMINYKWISDGLRAHAHFGFPGKLSDHSPCLVSLFDNSIQGVRPFKFFNMWTVHEDFQRIVWETQIYGSAMFRLCRKLKLLKEPLKELNKKHFSHISARAAAAEENLYDLQQRLHDNTADVTLQDQMMKAKQTAFKLAEAERSFCSQQLAKMKYPKDSDKGSKYFHDLIKSNRNKSQIVSISLSDGSRSTSQQQVNESFIEFYKNLLGSSSDCSAIDISILMNGKLVDDGQATELMRAITDKEIKESLFSIGDDKAPGPDGYSAHFFKRAWNIVGTEFCEAVKEFFSSGQILKQMNHSMIALVPKSCNASKVEEFRPIACCNVSYKVISKILAGRLSVILPNLIDSAQAAFVQGRSMVENIYLVQELLFRYGWSMISPRCIMKIDLRKAFDTINWAFVKEVLMGLGFPNLFVGWIMQCISTTSYSISINGSMHGFFKGYQGIRQGDPISPFLFVLCLEYLSRSLNQLKDNQDFNFHPRCKDLNITHLAFADDLILFSRGDVDSESQGKTLRVSSLYQVLLWQGRLPFRYLGLPVSSTKLTIAQFQPFTDRISGHLNTWTSLKLSYAGRCELISSVLQGVECFWLASLPIPTGIRERLIRMCRNFLWGGKCFVSKKPLVAWDSICLPKMEGEHLDMGIHWEETRFSNDETNALYPRYKIFAMEGSMQAVSNRMGQWVLEGRFRSKLAYEFFRPRREIITWPKMVWSSCLMPKHSFILWLGLKDRLLTRDKIQEFSEDKSCPLCTNLDESVDHLFFQCNVAKQVWLCVKQWLGISRSMSTLKAAAKWIFKEARGTGIQAKAKKIGLACAVYYIWEARNERIFEGNLIVLYLNRPIHSLFLGDGCCGFCSENLVMCCGLSPDMFIGVVILLMWLRSSWASSIPLAFVGISLWVGVSVSWAVAGWSCFDVASRWLINYVCWFALADGGGSDLFLLDCCCPCCWFALVLGCCPLVPISIAVDASCCRADTGMMLSGASGFGCYLPEGALDLPDH
ncbi:hypothetical protein Acr_07g0016920 [Actinidia rufa]|uniref:Reverse transcriptase domain-containing protein n=1 Tax=Actinidia rufa TaxID=165716 RepID=A0A7J0EZ84_9ERIC|nr:hypothetical protein Acr_07g0016920 [Actinidia rufa]